MSSTQPQPTERCIRCLRVPTRKDLLCLMGKYHSIVCSCGMHGPASLSPDLAVARWDEHVQFLRAHPPELA